MMLRHRFDTRRRIVTVASAILCAMLLVACGKAKEIKKPPPLPVPKINATVQLKKLWSRDIGSSEAFGVGLIPQIVDGRVYSADSAGNVIAIDAKSGKQIWRTYVEQKISGAVGVGGSHVAVGTPDGKVVVLDREKGEIVWQKQVISEVLAPPVIGDGVVVVRTVDGSVTGLDAESGDKKWTFRRPVPGLTLRGSGAPLITEGVVIAGFADGKILAADIATGSIRWDAQVAYSRGRNEVERLIDIDGRPLLVGSVLYVASYQGRVLAMALGSRRVVWARDISSYVDLGADSGRLYVSDEEGRVLGLDRLTGDTVWKQENLLRRNLSGPEAFEDYVVVGDLDGYLHIMSKEDGSLVGQERVTGAAIKVTPLVVDNVLYVLAQNGTLTAFTLRGQ